MAKSNGAPLNGKWPKPTRKYPKWLWVACLLVLALGAGGYFCYEYFQFEKMKAADYVALEGVYEIDPYTAFLAKYPSSKYETDVRERLHQLEMIRDQWCSIAESDSVDFYCVRFKIRNINFVVKVSCVTNNSSVFHVHYMFNINNVFITCNS